MNPIMVWFKVRARGNSQKYTQRVGRKLSNDARAMPASFNMLDWGFDGYDESHDDVVLESAT